jgi:hypothetical protein
MLLNPALVWTLAGLVTFSMLQVKVETGPALRYVTSTFYPEMPQVTDWDESVVKQRLVLFVFDRVIDFGAVKEITSPKIRGMLVFKEKV